MASSFSSKHFNRISKTRTGRKTGATNNLYRYKNLRLSDSPAEAHAQRRQCLSPGGSVKCPSFKLMNYVNEDHQSALFGCCFNQYLSTSIDIIEEESTDVSLYIFATVGSNRATIYECLPNGLIEPMQVYSDPDSRESFYACAWIYLTKSDEHLLAIGGLRGIIQFISPAYGDSVAALIGHGHAINDLIAHPVDSNLLLSGSKDHSVRFWNVETQVCIAMFSGVDGHRDEVLSIDFDVDGQRIISCGMDHSIKIWNLDQKSKVPETIKLSYTFSYSSKPSTSPSKEDDEDVVVIVEDNSKVVLPTDDEVDVVGNKKSKVVFPTVRIHYPNFSTRDLHTNYVDCVKFFGELIISKSCENYISIWKPGNLEQLDYAADDTNASLLVDLEMSNSQVWFIKMAIDPSFRLLACGNQRGRILVWDLSSPNIIAKPYATVLKHPKCLSTIRQVTFSPDGRIMVAVCDDATVWCWKKV